jgi:hypothetical protein
VILDLNELSRQADAWLLAQPCGRALCPCAITYFRSRFCLPWFLADAIRRDEEKGA